MLSTRLALLNLARHQRLTPDAYNELIRISARGSPLLLPAGLIGRRVQMFALLLMGVGLIFFIAANWHEGNTVPMFAGLETGVVGACVGAARWSRLRAALTLLAVLLLGALLAFFGQYYQSGADSWQLFALWGGLALPLSLAARSEAVWCAWVIIAFTAISTWLKSSGDGWFWDRVPLDMSVTAGLLAFVISVLFSDQWRRYTGAARWSMNLAVLLSVSLVTSLGIASLLDKSAGFYWFALLAFMFALPCFTQGSDYDVCALTVCALGVDVLLISGVAWLSFDMHSIAVSLLVIGLTVLGTLVSTVRAILHFHRQHTSTEAT